MFWYTHAHSFYYGNWVITCYNHIIHLSGGELIDTNNLRVCITCRCPFLELEAVGLSAVGRQWTDENILPFGTPADFFWPIVADVIPKQFCNYCWQFDAVQMCKTACFPGEWVVSERWTGSHFLDSYRMYTLQLYHELGGLPFLEPWSSSSHRNRQP